MPTFHGLLSIVLVLLILNTVYSFSKKEAPSAFKSELFTWSLVLACIYLLGTIGTNHPDRAQFDVVQKSSIVLIGFLLISGNLKHPSLLKWTKLAFVISNILALLICLGFGLANYFNSGEIEALFYTRLSIFLHPGYFSMYLCLSLAFLLYDLSQETPILLNKSITWIAVTLLFIGLYLLASKSGILTGILIILLFVIRAVRQSKYSRRFLFILGLSFSGLILLFAFLPSKSNRLKTLFSDFSEIEKKKDYQLNTAGQRVLIWQAAYEVIRNNFWIGTGVGNENQEMLDIFERKGQNFLLEKKPNAHNQFLQVFMSLGVSGFLFFCAYIFLPVYYAFKRKDILLLSFGVIVIFNALTESTFNRQAGMLFWVVWGFLLIEGYRKNLPLKA